MKDQGTHIGEFLAHELLLTKEREYFENFYNVLHQKFKINGEYLEKKGFFKV